MSDPTSADCIVAIANVATSLAVIAGVGIAYVQLRSWRQEVTDTKRSEVAEALISSAYNVVDALNEIRNPFVSIPHEKVKDKKYLYEMLHKRIVESNDTFKELRQDQIRALAVIGDESVDASVSDLFLIRSRVSTAIALLVDLSEEDSKRSDKDLRNFQVKLRRDMAAHGGEDDQLSALQEKALKNINDRLRPIARLEQTRTKK